VVNKAQVGLQLASKVKSPDAVPFLSEVHMSNVCSRACTLFVLLGGLGIGACAAQTQREDVGSSIMIISPSGLPSSSLSAMSAETNNGWTCLQPLGAGGGFICAPRGLGLPSVPPVPNYGGAPTYNLSAFTPDHQFVHRFKLLRPDLYHHQPCLGGDEWEYIPFLDYFECVIKE
jgi:hypothetical protein